MHASAIILFSVMEFFFPVYVAGILLLLLSANYSINKYALLKAANAIVSVVWDANNEWKLETQDGTVWSAELVPDSYVHPLLTILIFKEVSEKRLKLFPSNVVLLKDSINTGDFRRLRVRLKVGKPNDPEQDRKG
ncbi:MAG TPA: hypothetical protein ENK06_03530 [Gammaproteobacteria bacterium]|nr:hypothetical protein [Gammaproteobacteria bacterium]